MRVMMENNGDKIIDVNEKVRISPRISRKTCALAKALYPVMGGGRLKTGLNIF